MTAGHVRQAKSAAKPAFTQLQKVAEQLLMEEQRSVQRWVPKSIYDVAERAGLDRPTWFAPYVDAMHRALDEEVQLCFSAPPQHGKTTTTCCALVYHCLTSPGRTYAYVSYNADIAQEFRQEMAFIFEACGLVIRTANNKLFINGGARKGGSTILFTSIQGGITGRAITGFIIVDDPIKNQKDARSSSVASNMYTEFWRTFMTRQQERKSVVVMMTRWMSHDLAGLLISDANWTSIRIPAICDSLDDPIGRQLGEPLYPKKYSLDALIKYRDKVPFDFEAMFQGNPRTQEGTLFVAPATYTEVPRWATMVSTGLDVSYAGTRKSDWSTLVRMRTDKGSGLTYVDVVDRKQCFVHDFIPTIKMRRDRGGPIKWYHGSGPELGVGQFLQENIPEITLEPAQKGKYDRVINSGFHAAWNEGRVLVPREEDRSPMMQAFIDEVMGFTGTQADDHDDFVDAAAAAYSFVGHSSAPLQRTQGRIAAAADRARQRRERVW